MVVFQVNLNHALVSIRKTAKASSQTKTELSNNTNKRNMNSTKYSNRNPAVIKKRKSCCKLPNVLSNLKCSLALLKKGNRNTTHPSAEPL